MDIGIILLVLGSAAMSAAMHAFVKIGANRFITFCCINLVATVPAIVMVIFLPNISAEAWLYIPLSVLLHHSQKICLLVAYGAGDLSRIYPIMRGSAPLVVMAFAIVFLGENLGYLQVAGLLLITLGLLYLAVSGAGFHGVNRKATLFALAAGISTAGYTVVDGMGARVSGSPVSFIAWLYVFDGIPFIAYATYRHRTELIATLRNHFHKLVVVGLMSIASYGIVVYALTRAPMGPVSALRESSVIFGALFGTIWLKESFGAQRLLSAILIAGGIAALIFSR